MIRFNSVLEFPPFIPALITSIFCIELSESNLTPTNNTLPFLQSLPQNLPNYDENIEADDEAEDKTDDEEFNIENDDNYIKTIPLTSNKGLSLIKSSKISNNHEKKKNVNNPFLFFNDADDF